MNKIKCTLKLGELPLHLYQITAGYHLLERQGIIDLEISKTSENPLPYNMLEVTVNNRKVLYDLNDGYDNLLESKDQYIDFMDTLLEEYDICFKRSYSKMLNSNLKQGNKIYPLGLNYMVTVPSNIAHIPNKWDPPKERIKKLLRLAPFTEYYNGHYSVRTFEDFPRVNTSPRILFMARLWDIEGDFAGQLTEEKKQERMYINDFRASCIRMLKKEFRDQFYGGISPSPFSINNYQDIVINEKKLTNRNYYLNKVKEASICVATMGLHESIGWKFGEYIAASKAIVTEELHYSVTGNLNEGSHFLVFRSPLECVEKTLQLVNNEELRHRMMFNNYIYYQRFVRPDQLVMNSLLTALEETVALGGECIARETDGVYAYI